MQGSLLRTSVAASVTIPAHTVVLVNRSVKGAFHE
jgi:hypothetical protein